MFTSPISVSYLCSKWHGFLNIASIFAICNNAVLGTSPPVCCVETGKCENSGDDEELEDECMNRNESCMSLPKSNK